jgi:hypothetical protein
MLARFYFLKFFWTTGKPEQPERWSEQESRNDQEIRNAQNDRCANIVTERSILRG